MHINVRDLLVESLGYSRNYKIAGERPDLPVIRLTEDVVGNINISRSESGLLVQGTISTAVELECHRCLRTFTRPTHVPLEQTYSEHPDGDDLPITDETIDLAPLIEQEIVVRLPIKILHDEDCEGIQNVSAKYTKEESSGLKNRARITKGPSHRGRTEETNHS